METKMWIRIFLVMASLILLVVFSWSAVRHGGSKTVSGMGVVSATVVDRADPATKEQLDRIERLLRDRQNQLTSRKLLAKYPFGYVIYFVTYARTVLPYKTDIADSSGWSFDWSTASVGDQKETLDIRLPSIQTPHNVVIDGMRTTLPKRVGPFPLPLIRFGRENMYLTGETVAITKDGVVFILGFVKDDPAYLSKPRL